MSRREGPCSICGVDFASNPSLPVVFWGSATWGCGCDCSYQRGALKHEICCALLRCERTADLAGGLERP